MKNWTNGIYGGTGDPLAVQKPLSFTGTVWYVDSVTGSDGNSGDREDVPFATLATAIAATASGDIVVLLPTHDETITSTITPGASNVTIVGTGSAAGIPTSSLRRNTSSTMLDVGVTGFAIFGVRFKESLVLTTNPNVDVSAISFWMRGCYVEMGSNDRGAGVRVTLSTGESAADADIRLESTTFISTATTNTRPVAGFQCVNDLKGVYLDGVVGDDGTHGFSRYAIDLQDQIVRLRADNISLLNGANMKVESTSTGWVNIARQTGGGSLNF